MLMFLKFFDYINSYNSVKLSDEEKKYLEKSLFIKKLRKSISF